MADSGIEIQKGKLSLFVTTYIQSKKWTQHFLTSIQRFPTLKAKFVCEKSQKMKIHTRDKKIQHYFLWNWKPFQVVYIIGHEWDGMTCVELIDCVSRVSVSSVSLAVEILRKNNKASQVKCHQRPFWSVSVFFGVVGKNPSMEDLPGSLLRSTGVHKTLKILLRGVNLCWRNAASMIALENAMWFDLQHNFLFWTRPKHSLLK